MENQAEIELERCERRVLHQVWMKRRPVRWSELLDEVRLSSRTLTLALETLQKKGVIVRFVDMSSGNYPPPVYYYVTEDARKRLLEDELANSFRYDVVGIMIGRTVHRIRGLGGRSQEVIETIGRTISAVHLYAILEKLRTGRDWYNLPHGKFEELVSTVLLAEDVERSLAELKAALRSVYPEEVKVIEEELSLWKDFYGDERQKAIRAGVAIGILNAGILGVVEFRGNKPHLTADADSLNESEAISLIICAAGNPITATEITDRLHESRRSLSLRTVRSRLNDLRKEGKVTAIKGGYTLTMAGSTWIMNQLSMLQQILEKSGENPRSRNDTQQPRVD